MGKNVELHTSAGVIRVELDDAKAPASVENFLAYVRSGHFDGTVFHRVIKGFMIQGGGMDSSMKQKSTLAPIANEVRKRGYAVVAFQPPIYYKADVPFERFPYS